SVPRTRAGRRTHVSMRPTRSLALAGAAGVLATPAAIALAAEPDTAPGTIQPLDARLAGSPTLRAQMRGAEHDRLLHRLRRLAKAAGEHHPDARIWSNGRLRGEIRRLRAALRAQRVTTAGAAAPAAGGGSVATPQLAAIAACESGGDPHAVGRRAAFPVLDRLAYLNAGTCGPVPRAAVEAARAELESAAEAGRWTPYFERLRDLQARHRAAYAARVGARPEDVALTTSTTDGVARVVAALGLRRGDEIVTSEE